MKPNERLTVLLLEDNPEDAELELHELKRAGYGVDSVRVETEPEFAAALKPEVDLILADFNLPRYDGMSALRLLKQRGLDIPFILVSGAIGEEKAVEVMLEGAFAYVMKSRLVSLGAIVARALKDTALSRENAATHMELRKSEKRYRRLFESSLDGLLILDAATGKVLDANPALLAMLGYSFGEIIGRAPWELEAFAGLTDAKVDLKEMLPLARVRYDDLPLTTKAGVRLSAELVGAAYGDEGARVIQCSLRDITERKRLQAQFFQSQKMESIGLLAGGVAHDFNNILMTIMACSEFLRESFAKTDPRRADVEEIDAAAARAAALTRQLLIFSRKQLVQPSVLDLNELLRNLQKMLGRLIGEDLALELVLCPQPLMIRVDPGQMEQVIMNLCVNAREAMPNGGAITLKTEIRAKGEACLPGCCPAGEADCARLVVSDTGCGMSAEVLSHLFEPFFTTRGPGKGTGLGLSTVYGIVAAAGGDVVASSVVGKGSVFTVCLPLIVAGAAPRPHAAAPARSTRGRETVLIVEDDEAVLHLNERILREQGYRVLSARDGEEALVFLKDPANQVSLLLTDVVMPGISGGELADRAVKLRPKLKVVFVTGYIDESRLGQIKALKGQVLHKPLAPKVLALRVREILDRAAG